jgi:hypothetical protein
MRGTILTALALSFIRSSGVLAGCAEAATIGPSSASHAAAGRKIVIERIAHVCGANGCVPVQTKPIIHRQTPGTIAGNRI